MALRSTLPSAPNRTMHFLFSAGVLLALLSSSFTTQTKSPEVLPAHADRVFKVGKWIEKSYGERISSTQTVGMLAPALRTHFPEVAAAARSMQWAEAVDVQVNNQSVQTNNWYFADPALLQILGIQILRGQTTQAFAAPGRVVLSQSFARKMFGGADPVGKTFMGLGGKTYTVCAVAQSAGGKLHLPFDVLASWASTEPSSGLHDFRFMNDWLGQVAQTYVLLHRRDQMTQVQAQLPAFAQRYLSGHARQFSYFLKPMIESQSKTGEVGVSGSALGSLIKNLAEHT